MLTERARVGPVARLGKRRSNLLRKQHLHDLTGLGALDQAQRPATQQAADGGTRATFRDANAVAEPRQREMEAAPAFELAVPEEMGVHRTVQTFRASFGTTKSSRCFQTSAALAFFFHG